MPQTEETVRPVIVRPNMLTRRLECRLTEEEYSAKLEELAQATRALAEESTRLAGFQESMKRQKAVVTDVEGERSRLSITITDKRETRSIECSEIMDFYTSRVFARRDDTDEIVSVRNMHDEELQMSISDLDEELEELAMTPEELGAAVKTFYRNHPDQQPAPEDEHDEHEEDEEAQS